MFVLVPKIRRVDVRLKGTGQFFCLYCEADRKYEHRKWLTTAIVFFIPLMGVGGGEFILCSVCECAFDLECLDESSTATCDELMLTVPDKAIRGRARVDESEGLSLAEYVGALPSGDDGLMKGHAESVAETRQERTGRKSGLSAHSTSRRH